MIFTAGDKVEVLKSGIRGEVTTTDYNRVYVLIDGAELKFMSWDLKIIN